MSQPLQPEAYNSPSDLLIKQWFVGVGTSISSLCPVYFNLLATLLHFCHC